MRINQNIAALNSYRNLSNNETGVSKSLEKLSSGTRINRAADDASGLVISQGLRAQIGGLNQATRNAQDGISVVQTAEGALNEVHTMLGRMRDLAVQASNTGSNDTAGRTAAQKEVTELSTEINRLSDTTKFGSTKLLDGTYGAKFASSTTAAAFTPTALTASNNQFKVSFDGGTTETEITVPAGNATTDYDSPAKLAAAMTTAANAQLETAGVTGRVTISASVGAQGASFTATSSNATGAANLQINAGTADILGVTGSFGTSTQTGVGGSFQVGADNTANDRISVNITDTHTATLFGGTGTLDLVGGAGDAIDTIDAAISTVSDTRAQLGAKQNRFESVISNLQVATENLSSSESRIRDTDYAQEMVKFTRGQILNQAATSMLGQANKLPQSVLSLLQG